MDPPNPTPHQPHPSPVRVPPTKSKLWESADPSPTLPPLSPQSSRAFPILGMTARVPFLFSLEPSPGPLAGLSSSSLRPSTLMAQGRSTRELFLPSCCLSKNKLHGGSVLIYLCFCALDQKIKTRGYSRCSGCPAQIPLAREVIPWVLTTVTPTSSPEKCPQAQERRAGEAVSPQPHLPCSR